MQCASCTTSDLMLLRCPEPSVLPGSGIALSLLHTVRSKMPCATLYLPTSSERIYNTVILSSRIMWFKNMTIFSLFMNLANLSFRKHILPALKDPTFVTSLNYLFFMVTHV